MLGLYTLHTHCTLSPTHDKGRPGHLGKSRSTNIIVLFRPSIYATSKVIVMLYIWPWHPWQMNNQYAWEYTLHTKQVIHLNCSSMLYVIDNQVICYRISRNIIHSIKWPQFNNRLLYNKLSVTSLSITDLFLVVVVPQWQTTEWRGEGMSPRIAVASNISCRAKYTRWTLRAHDSNFE